LLCVVVVAEYLARYAFFLSEHGSVRLSRVAQLERQECILARIEPQAPELLRDRPAEEAHLRGLRADVLRDLVSLLDLQLTGDDLLAHVVADGREDLLESLLVDALGHGIRVRVHHCSLFLPALRSQPSSTISVTASTIAAGRS